LRSLLKTDLSLGSPTPEGRSYEDCDVWSEAPIPLRHDFPDETYCDNFEEAMIPEPF